MRREDGCEKKKSAKKEKKLQEKGVKMSIYLKTSDLALKYGVAHSAVKSTIRKATGESVVNYRPDRAGGYFISPEDEEKVAKLLLAPPSSRKRSKKKKVAEPDAEVVPTLTSETETVPAVGKKSAKS